MPTYVLGRNQEATLPGVDNADIRDVRINVAADELDVTVFGDTDVQTMTGLAEITVEVVCLNHSAAVGDKGAFDVAGLDALNLDACVTNISETVSPRGVVEYTITYTPVPQTNS